MLAMIVILFLRFVMIVVLSSAMADTALSLSMTVIVAPNQRSKFCFVLKNAYSKKHSYMWTQYCAASTLWRLHNTEDKVLKAKKEKEKKGKKKRRRKVKEKTSPSKKV